MLTDKKLLKKIVDSFHNIDPDSTIQNICFNMIDKLINAEVLEGIIYEDNHIVMLERVVLEDGWGIVRHICTQCNVNTLPANIRRMQRSIVSTVVPRDIDHFIMDEDSVCNELLEPIFWCYLCGCPLFDWSDYNGCVVENDDHCITTTPDCFEMYCYSEMCLQSDKNN